MKLEELRESLSEGDRIWLQEWLSEIKKHDSPPNALEMLVQLWGRLPKDFSFSGINPMLFWSNYNGANANLTLIGIYLIAPEDELLVQAHQVILAIKNKLLDNPLDGQIESEALAEDTDLSLKRVEQILGLLRDLGNFWNGASGSQEGMYELISVRSESVLLEYLRYSDILELLERRVEFFSSEGSVLPPSSKEEQPETEESTWKDKAFVIMEIDPRNPALEDKLQAIKDVCSEFNISAIRADGIEHEGKITDVVLENIRRSEFLIADLSGERPNVYYEVGYAHSLKKRTIMYRQKGTDLHFDLANYNVPEYANNTELREKLRKRLEAITGISPQ